MALLMLNCSVYWEHFYQQRDYPNLLPACPRLIDPANPANNVWTSGFLQGGRLNDYAEGDGDSTVLKRYIHTIDLSKAL